MSELPATRRSRSNLPADRGSPRPRRPPSAAAAGPRRPSPSALSPAAAAAGRPRPGRLPWMRLLAPTQATGAGRSRPGAWPLPQRAAADAPARSRCPRWLPPHPLLSVAAAPAALLAATAASADCPGAQPVAPRARAAAGRRGGPCWLPRRPLLAAAAAPAALLAAAAPAGCRGARPAAPRAGAAAGRPLRLAGSAASPGCPCGSLERPPPPFAAVATPTCCRRSRLPRRPLAVIVVGRRRRRNARPPTQRAGAAADPAGILYSTFWLPLLAAASAAPSRLHMARVRPSSPTAAVGCRPLHAAAAAWGAPAARCCWPWPPRPGAAAAVGCRRCSEDPPWLGAAAAVGCRRRSGGLSLPAAAAVSCHSACGDCYRRALLTLAVWQRPRGAATGCRRGWPPRGGRWLPSRPTATTAGGSRLLAAGCCRPRCARW